MIIHGALVSSRSQSELLFAPRALVSINSSGVIDWLIEDVAPDSVDAVVLRERGTAIEGEAEVLRLKRGQFVCPGLIDTHTHAPQYPNIGLGGQYQLLDWLANVTFPREAKFNDMVYAKRVYELVVRRTLSLGTTTSCYYGTLYGESTMALADIIHMAGQRAFVGKCNMDANCPDHYTESSAAESLTETRRLIDHIRAIPSPSLVHPILTPRFAISCSPALLKGLGSLAHDEREAGRPIAIQTHLGENHGEISFTKEIFSREGALEGAKGDWDGTYTGVYDQFGLLGDRTILAHCVHLEECELQTIKRTGSGVSHCPTSNLNLRSGCARIGDMLDRGIKVGLGTDCSGGYESGLLTQIRAACTTSKLVHMTAPSSAPTPDPQAPLLANRPQLPLPTLFHMATLGGASLCGLDDKIGSFEVGKAWDALLVDLAPERGNASLWWDPQEDGDWFEGGFEQWIFSGDDRNLAKVWVQGRAVAGMDVKV